MELDFSRPGKPTDNAFIEAFNGRFRQECLNENWFLSLEDAEEKVESWSLSHKADISRGSIFCIPSFDEMTNLTPYFNHVIPAYAGIQTVSHSASQVEDITVGKDPTVRWGTCPRGSSPYWLQ